MLVRYDSSDTNRGFNYFVETQEEPRALKWLNCDESWNVVLPYHFLWKLQTVPNCPVAHKVRIIFLTTFHENNYVYILLELYWSICILQKNYEKIKTLSKKNILQIYGQQRSVLKTEKEWLSDDVISLPTMHCSWRRSPFFWTYGRIPLY